MKKLLLISMMCLIFELNAQNFTDINPFPMHQQDLIVTPQFGDINADGWLDVLANRELYINQKNGSFKQYFIKPIALTPYFQGSINTVLGDFNNDGLPDILASFKMTDNKNYTKIYRNTGRDSSGFWIFEDINANIKGIINTGFAKSLQSGDYDNDGDLDILILGNSLDLTETTPHSDIYRNDNGNFTAIKAGFHQLRDGTASFVDLENDGDLDVIVTGNATELYASSPYTRVYINNDGKFTDSGLNLLNLEESTVTWADYDMDGKSDIFIQGRESFTPKSGLYHNDGNLKFTLKTDKFLSRYWGDASWGDLDNDGDLDLLTSGEPLGAKAYIYKNNNSNFEIWDSIPSGRITATSFGDYDNDGDLDILYASFMSDLSNSVVFTIFRNELIIKNQDPKVPLNLKSAVNGKNVSLTWDKSSDNETAANGLTYNIYVGNGLNKIGVVTPHSNLANGKRVLAEYGNCQQNLSRLIKGLPDGVYYWSVQAVDNCLEGSVFAPEQTFTIGNPAPIDTLKLIAPNGGEIYKPNDAITIKWDGLYANESIVVEFSSDNGNNWQVLTNNGVNKQYNWIAPDIQSTKCLAKVSTSAKLLPQIIQRFNGLPASVRTVRYSNDGKSLLSYSLDSNFRIWDIKTGSEVAKFRNYTPPSNPWSGYYGSYADFSIDNSKIITVEQYTPSAFITVWNSNASQSIYELNIANDQYYVLATLSPDNRFLAVANATNLEIYDINNPSVHDKYKSIKFAEYAYAKDIAYSYNGKFIGIAAYDSNFVLIDTDSWSVVHKFKMGHWISSIDFNHTDTQVLIADYEGNLIIWDIMKHDIVEKFKVDIYINDASYSQDDSKAIFSNHIDKAGIFDFKAKKMLCDLKDNSVIFGARMSPDMQYAVTTDSIIKIWQLNPISALSDVSDANWTILKDTKIPFIELAIDNIEGAINEIIEVPIRLKNATNLSGSGITSIKTTIKFNGNVLYPVKSTEMGTLSGNLRHIYINLPITPSSDNILAKLNFEILLGDAESTMISFENSEAIGGTALFSETSGMVTITNICKDGGIRLVKSSNNNAKIQIGPIPATDYLNIISDKNIFENENEAIIIYDQLGNIVHKFSAQDIIQFDNNTNKANISHLLSGLYFIRIQNNYYKFIKI